MRVLWCTDLHLDHCEDLKALAFSQDLAPLDLFLHKLAEKRPDVILISGDISNAKRLWDHLTMISKVAPTYFVLGNHDFYGSTIKQVRSRAIAATAASNKKFYWLQHKGVVPLTNEICVVGVDGWGDARAGDVSGSRVGLSDWELIEELTYYPRLAPELRQVRSYIEGLGGKMPRHANPSHPEARKKRERALRKLGSDDAGRLQKHLRTALMRFDKVFVVTHVPPWPEAAWYRGKPSGQEWLPWFCCVAVGEVISTEARMHPDKKITVLCGHTHGSGISQIHENVKAFTGEAFYAAPAIQRVFEI